MLTLPTAQHAADLSRALSYPLPHAPFPLCCRYARSHLYLGFEVLFFCATLYATNDCSTCNYTALTWNSWMLAFTLILCPLWFNPFIFNLSKVQREFVTWKRWLAGDMDSGTGTNWCVRVGGLAAAERVAALEITVTSTFLEGQCEGP